MAQIVAFFVSFMPHRLIGAAVLRHTFLRFARTNGLVYIGLLVPSDDYEPVRGFTANPGQVDNFVVHGSVHGRELTMLQRAVTHGNTTNGTGIHSHTWLIAATKHDIPHAPHLLLLSHEHPRLHDEAVAIHHSKSQHVSIDYRLDARYLVYGKPAAAEDFRELITNEFVERLLAVPGYDYEFDKEYIYVYSHSTKPSETELLQLLNSSLTLVNVYEKSPA